MIDESVLLQRQSSEFSAADTFYYYCCFACQSVCARNGKPISEERSQQNAGEEFRLQMEEGFDLLNEVLVQTLDFYYFYSSNSRFFLSLLWESWSAVPAVSDHVDLYVLRSIATIAAQQVVDHEAPDTSIGPWSDLANEGSGSPTAYIGLSSRRDTALALLIEVLGGLLKKPELSSQASRRETLTRAIRFAKGLQEEIRESVMKGGTIANNRHLGASVYTIDALTRLAEFVRHFLTFPGLREELFASAVGSDGSPFDTRPYFDWYGDIGPAVRRRNPISIIRDMLMDRIRIDGEETREPESRKSVQASSAWAFILLLASLQYEDQIGAKGI